MATNLPADPPKQTTVSPKAPPSSPPVACPNIEHGTPEHGDGRSSSLSEIGDGDPDVPSPSAQAEQLSEAGETEAETERLDDSPHKPRKTQNIVLAASNERYSDDGAVVNQTVSTKGDSTEVNGVPILQTSEISSLEDSSDVPNVTPSRKRKRSALTPSPRGSREASRTTTETTTNPSRTDIGKSLKTLTAAEDPEDAEGSFLSEHEDQGTLPRAGSAGGEHAQANDKRRTKKLRGDSDETLERPNSVIGIVVDPPETMAEDESHAEDEEMEEAVDDMEADTDLRTEESLAKKKTAMDTLGAIETCFASLKEKLYDEKIARCNAELAMLESTTPTHPELVAALDVIDNHRDKKIQYEDTRIKFKLESLQRESMAEKAQAHSQYMLDVQDTRERHQDKLNEAFYQIQRERRSADTSAPSYMYHFPTKRSEQIRRQTAYNKEISILSGVAKYVGFPAAPDLKRLKQDEIDEDLKAMGISLQRAPQLPRPNVTASSSLSRQKSVTNERFLEQNPWANPQHPAHSYLHRQRSAVSRPESPLVTPAQQKRVIDLTGTQGSASTMTDTQSGPGSSTGPTPLTTERTSKVIKASNGGGMHSTPIKHPELPNDGEIPTSNARDDSTERRKFRSVSQQGHPVNHSHKAHLRGTSFADPMSVGEPAHTLSAKNDSHSSPPHFTQVKAEEPFRIHSAPLGHYQTPVQVGAGMHGQANRLGAT